VAAPHAVVPVVEEPCEGGIVVEAPGVDSVCEAEDRFWPGSCVVPLEVTVRNCGGDKIEIAKVVLADGDWIMIEWTFDPGTGPAPGEKWEFTRSQPLPDGSYRIGVTCAGTETLTAWVDLVVSNSALDAAMSACEECKGEFGPHGLAGIVGCICAARDAGRPCDDGSDCEGLCISVEGEFRCSDLVTVFGCHSYLPERWSLGPQAALAPYMCAD